MRKFLEFEKSQTEEEILLGLPQEIVRIDISEENQEKIREIVEFLLEHLKDFECYFHYCYHDEPIKRPCQREKLVR